MNNLSEILQTFLSLLGIESLRLDGKTLKNDRPKIVEKFNEIENKTINVLVKIISQGTFFTIYKKKKNFIFIFIILIN
jgi:hypothetical protein